MRSLLTAIITAPVITGFTPAVIGEYEPPDLGSPAGTGGQGTRCHAQRPSKETLGDQPAQVEGNAKKATWTANQM